MLPVVQVVIVAEGVLAPSAKPHRDVTGSVGQRKTERRSRRSEIVRRYQDDVRCQYLDHSERVPANLVASQWPAEDGGWRLTGRSPEFGISVSHRQVSFEVNRIVCER
jgi:hypothetical protein